MKRKITVAYIDQNVVNQSSNDLYLIAITHHVTSTQF